MSDIPRMKEIYFSPEILQVLIANRDRDGFPTSLDELISEQDPLTLSYSQKLDFARAIARLPRQQKRVIELTLKNNSISQISKKLSIDTGAVSRHLARAIDTLRKQLNPNLN